MSALVFDCDGVILESVNVKTEAFARELLQLFSIGACQLQANGKLQGGWTMMSTIFAVVFVMITLAGTLWVMFHMNTNMMPKHTDIPALSQPAATPAVEAAAAPVAESSPAAAAHTGHSSN